MHAHPGFRLHRPSDGPHVAVFGLGYPGKDHFDTGPVVGFAVTDLAVAVEEVLTPFGIDDRRLAVLLLIGSNEAMSQQQAAERLGIDRTTMVAALDDLDTKNLLTRVPQPGDRRRNVVELTASGTRRFTIQGIVAI